MELNELVTGVLTKTLNKTDEEIAALLYTKAEGSEELVLRDDAIELVLDHDVKRIDNVKKNVKPDEKRLKSEYSRGQKEALGKLETDVRTKYGVESTAQGLDLIDSVIAELSKSNGVSDDDVKKHPLYLQIEQNSVRKEDYEKIQADFEEHKSNVNRNQRISRVKSDALSITNTLNPIISDNPAVARTRQDDYLAKYNAYDYEIDENGNHLVLTNGKRLEDEHGNPVKFEDHVKNIASMCYEFKEGAEGDNSGNKKERGATSIDLPKTEKEYLSRMSEFMLKRDTKGQADLQKAWEAANK